MLANTVDGAEALGLPERSATKVELADRRGLESHGAVETMPGSWHGERWLRGALVHRERKVNC